MGQRASGLDFKDLLGGVILALSMLPAIGWPLTPEQVRGQQLYLTGTPASGGAVQAYVGAGSVALSGSVLPCANCHGADGRGRPEGGVIPSNITWPQLTKRYGVVSASGRRSPPYDETALSVAITEGLDPAGTALDSAMPRFAMAPEDLADLTAYLKVIDRVLDPGLSTNSIRLGTLVPASTDPNSLGQVISALYRAYFDDINAAGGVYNRELVLIEQSVDAENAILEGGKALVERQVFALLGAMTAGQGRPFGELMERLQVPLIGPLTAFSDDNNSSLNRYSFYLLAGTAVQQRALLDYAVKHLQRQDTRAVILYPQQAASAEIADLLQAQAALHGWSQVQMLGYPAAQLDATALVQQLKQAGVETLFFLGQGSSLQRLAAAAEQQGWTPTLLLSGTQSAQGLLTMPLGFDGKVFAVYPTLPTDLTAAGQMEFQRFHRYHGLSRHHLRTQIRAYASASLMLKGLKTAGRNLSREKLLTALEGLYQYQTGLTPELTFGPNQHLGANGAYIVGVNLKTGTFNGAGEWITPKQLR